LLKFDLKSGYHYLDIFEPHQKFFGFRMESVRDPLLFCLHSIAIGLSLACYVFTKLLCLLVKFWKGSGLKVVLYLDNGLAAVPDKERANRETIRVQSDLQKAGLISSPYGPQRKG